MLGVLWSKERSNYWFKASVKVQGTFVLFSGGYLPLPLHSSGRNDSPPACQIKTDIFITICIRGVWWQRELSASEEYKSSLHFNWSFEPTIALLFASFHTQHTWIWSLEVSFMDETELYRYSLADSSLCHYTPHIVTYWFKHVIRTNYTRQEIIMLVKRSIFS